MVLTQIIAEVAISMIGIVITFNNISNKELIIMMLASLQHKRDQIKANT